MSKIQEHVTVTVLDCTDAYNRAVDYHYPGRKRVSNASPEDFRRLALVLEKEQIAASKYIYFVFGILDLHPMYPPKPSALTNPMLIAKYRQMQ